MKAEKDTPVRDKTASTTGATAGTDADWQSELGGLAPIRVSLVPADPNAGQKSAAAIMQRARRGPPTPTSSPARAPDVFFRRSAAVPQAAIAARVPRQSGYTGLLQRNGGKDAAQARRTAGEHYVDAYDEVFATLTHLRTNLGPLIASYFAAFGAFEFENYTDLILGDQQVQGALRAIDTNLGAADYPQNQRISVRDRVNDMLLLTSLVATHSVRHSRLLPGASKEHERYAVQPLSPARLKSLLQEIVIATGARQDLEETDSLAGLQSGNAEPIAQRMAKLSLANLTRDARSSLLNDPLMQALLNSPQLATIMMASSGPDEQRFMSTCTTAAVNQHVLSQVSTIAGLLAIGRKTIEAVTEQMTIHAARLQEVQKSKVFRSDDTVEKVAMRRMAEAEQVFAVIRAQAMLLARAGGAPNFEAWHDLTRAWSRTMQKLAPLTDLSEGGDTPVLSNKMVKDQWMGSAVVHVLSVRPFFDEPFKRATPLNETAYTGAVGQTLETDRDLAPDDRIPSVNIRRQLGAGEQERLVATEVFWRVLHQLNGMPFSQSHSGPVPGGHNLYMKAIRRGAEQLFAIGDPKVSFYEYKSMASMAKFLDSDHVTVTPRAATLLADFLRRERTNLPQPDARISAQFVGAQAVHRQFNELAENPVLLTALGLERFVDLVEQAVGLVASDGALVGRLTRLFESPQVEAMLAQAMNRADATAGRPGAFHRAAGAQQAELVKRLRDPFLRFTLGKHLRETLMPEVPRGGDQQVVLRLETVLNNFLRRPEVADLPPDVRTRFHTSVRDKLSYGDMAVRPMLGRPADELRFSLYKVLAEVTTTEQLHALLKKLTPADLAKLAAVSFSGEAGYPGFREGSYRIAEAMAALNAGKDADPAQAAFADPQARQTLPVLTTIVRNIQKGYYAPDRFEALVDAQKGTLLQSDLLAISQTLATEAETKARSFRDLFAKNLETLTAAFAATLNEQPAEPQGAKDDAKAAVQKRSAAERAFAEQFVKAARAFGSKDHGAGFALYLDTFGFRVEALRQFTVRDADPQSADLYLQIMAQIEEMEKANPDRYLAGLEHMVMALPTAGKDLSQFTYVPTLVESLKGLVASINRQREQAAERAHPPVSLRDYPILVFDQSESAPRADGKQPLYARNEAFLKQIAADTGARIETISMQKVIRLGQRLGVTELFDTTGEGRAGFGGARNIVFLIAPMLKWALKNDPSVTSIDDLIRKPDEYLNALLHRMLSGQDQEMVLMGDDDTTVMPGFMHAKSMLAAEQSAGYGKVKTLTMGRATTSIPGVARADVVGGVVAPALDPRAPGRRDDPVEPFVNSLVKRVMGTTQFQDDPKTAAVHEMSGDLMHPATTLDLPLPSEEGQFDAYSESRIDYQGMTFHHPGDRFDTPGARLKGLVNYSAEVQQAIEFLGVGAQRGGRDNASDTLPWNQPGVGPFQSQGELYEYAAAPAVRQATQKDFFRRLVKGMPKSQLSGLEQGRTGLQALQNTPELKGRNAPLLEHDVAQVQQGYASAAAINAEIT